MISFKEKVESDFDDEKNKENKERVELSLDEVKVKENYLMENGVAYQKSAIETSFTVSRMTIVLLIVLSQKQREEEKNTLIRHSPNWIKRQEMIFASVADL